MFALRLHVHDKGILWNEHIELGFLAIERNAIQNGRVDLEICVDGCLDLLDIGTNVSTVVGEKHSKYHSHNDQQQNVQLQETEVQRHSDPEFGHQKVIQLDRLPIEVSPSDLVSTALTFQGVRVLNQEGLIRHQIATLLMHDGLLQGCRIGVGTLSHRFEERCPRLDIFILLLSLEDYL